MTRLLQCRSRLRPCCRSPNGSVQTSSSVLLLYQRMPDTTIPHKLTELRNKRDERLVRMWDTTKRVRATVKGTYGDDSSEYSLVGGTRMKAHRRPARKPLA